MPILVNMTKLLRGWERVAAFDCTDTVIVTTSDDVDAVLAHDAQGWSRLTYYGGCDIRRQPVFIWRNENHAAAAVGVDDELSYRRGLIGSAAVHPSGIIVTRRLGAFLGEIDWLTAMRTGKPSRYDAAAHERSWQVAKAAFDREWQRVIKPEVGPRGA
jgi:hypothetical protein